MDPDALSAAWTVLTTGGLAGLSVIALCALAAMLLRPPRVGAGATLGAFCLLWAFQVLAVRVAVILGLGGAGRPFLVLSEAALLPLYVLVVHVAAVYPRRIAIADKNWWPPALAVPAAAAVVVLFLEAPAPGGAAGGTVWGPLGLLVGVPFLLGFPAAFLRFSGGVRAARSAEERKQAEVAAVALLAYLSYYAVYLSDPPAIAPSIATTIYFSAVVAAVGMTLAGAAVLLASLGGRARWVALAALAVPALSSLAVRGSGIDLLGLWRSAFAAILGYGVLRYRVFDLDLRLRAGATRLVPAALGVGVALVVVAFAERAGLGGVPLEVFAAAAGAGALVGWASRKPARSWLEAAFPYVPASREYLARRRIEVYRAAVLAGAEPRVRARLAADLGITAEVRSVLEADALPGTPLQAGGLLGRYRVERVLAEQPRAVALAYDTRVGEPVVLKRYAGAAVAGFAREARALGELDHPHVLAVRDVFRAGGDLYLVTEHADQGSLEDMLAARGALPLDAALRITDELLQGLHEAHQRGIVHRDIKPANVLFRRGAVKLADFGVARDPVFEDAVRQLEAQPGTLAWMSPEQARDEPVTPASDVYAVGALLHRMLAGRPYLDARGRSEREVRNMVIRRQAAPLPVPPEVQALLARAMAKQAAERFPDAAAMLREVRKARRAARKARPIALPRAEPTRDSGDRTMDADALTG